MSFQVKVTLSHIKSICITSAKATIFFGNPNAFLIVNLLKGESPTPIKKNQNLLSSKSNQKLIIEMLDILELSNYPTVRTMKWRQNKAKNWTAESIS